MKRIYVRIFIMILIFLGTANYAQAQELCEDCKCEEEGVEDGTEDADYTLDVGEDGTEMSLDEADLMGSEVGEEIGTDAVEDIGLDLGEEALEAFAIDAAIPGIGEIAMVGEALIGGLILIFNAVEAKAIENAHEREMKSRMYKQTGDYVVPMVPKFSISGDDLNGSKDTLSFGIIMKRKIDSATVRQYLQERDSTTHIGDTLPFSKYSDYTPYAFSTFKKDLLSPDENYNGGDGYAYGVYSSEYLYLLSNQDQSKRYYSRKITDINISENSNNKANATVTSYWEHYNPVITYNDWPSGYANSPGDFSKTRTRTLTTTNEMVFELCALAKEDFWYRGTDGIVHSYKKGEIVVLGEVPYISENMNNEQVIFRIHDYVLPNIPESDTQVPARFVTKQKLEDGLYINVKVKAHKHYSYKQAYSYYWWEWVSKTENESRSDYTYHFPTMFDKSNNPNAQNNDPYDTGIPLNKMAMVEPELHDRILAYFKVHDFQPRDTDASIASATEISEVNPFPILYTSGTAEYEGKTIQVPEYGKSHLKIDIPYNSDWKQIDYIELEDLTARKTVILDFDVTDNGGTKKFTLSGYFNDATSSKNAITINAITPASTNEGLPSLSDNNYFNNVSVTNGSKTTLEFLLRNVPFEVSDLVNISTHYKKDGSLSRKMVKIKAANNFVPRAYYTFRNNSRNLVLRHGTLEDGSERADWLVELQPTGTYAISNRGTGGVLGFVNGEYGVYDWDPTNEGLHWQLKFLSDQSVKLFNIGQQGYLDLFDDGSLGFRFADGLVFHFYKRTDAEPIILSDTTYISNRFNNHILEVDESGIPVLTPQHELTTRDRSSKLVYTGCFTYAIYNESKKQYLYNGLHNNNLQWSKDNFTPWLYWKVNGSEYFTLKSKGRPLFANSEQYGGVGVDISKNPVMTEHKYHFKKASNIIYNDLIAHYAFDGNANDKSEYANHGTFHNGVSFVNDSERGKVASFDGVDDYINTSFDFHPDDFGGVLTASVWMKTDDWGKAYARLIDADSWSMTRDYTDNGIRFYTYHNNTDGKYYWIEPLPNPSLVGKNWHHIVVVVKPNGLGGRIKELYIDGTKAASFSSGNSSLPLRRNNVKTLIGKWSVNDTKNYKGFMDDVKIWRKAFTESEVATEYINTKQYKPLIAHYKLDGNAEDASVYKNHGTAHNGVTFVNDSQRGAVAKFDGVDDYIDVNYDFDPRYLGGDLSVAFWMKTNKKTLINILGTKQFGVNAQNTVSSFYSYNTTSGSSSRYISGGSVGDEKWHHVISVFDSKTDGNISIKLYIDGTFIGETVASEKFSTLTSKLGIGRWATFSNSPYIGFLDEIKIWKKALTLEEVSKEYTSTKIDIGKPVAIYNFNESNTNDSSGNNHHGTAHNGVTYRYDLYNAKRNTVVEFDGSNDYINTNFDFDPNNYNGDMTITLWMKNKKAAKSSPNLIAGGNFEIKKNENKMWGVVKIKDALNPGVTSQVAQTSIDMIEDNWYHIAYVMDKQDNGKVHQDVYINGILNKSRDGLHPLNTFKGNTIIGTDFNKNGYATYDGKLDDVVIWDKALSAAEVALLYKEDDPSKYVIKNLALNKSATQSTTAHNGVPGRAVDGNIDGIWGNNSVTHTNNDAQAWWQVDLGQLANITDVKVYNRTDCCSDRLTNYHIFVSDVPFTSNTVSGIKTQAGVGDFHETGQAGTPTIRNINRTGRYVRIQLESTNYLNLAEVQVFGSFVSGSSKASSEKNIEVVNDVEDIPLTSLIIHPNASDGHFNIDFGITKITDITYNIYNLSGQLLLSERKVFNKAGNHRWEINASQLSDGVYILEMTSDLWKESRRLIIKK